MAIERPAKILLGSPRLSGHVLHAGQNNCLATSGRFVASKLVTHVDAKMMHDHGHTRRTTAVRTKDGEEWRITMVSVTGVVEEACLFLFAYTDVGLSGKLSRHPAVVDVDGN